MMQDFHDDSDVDYYSEYEYDSNSEYDSGYGFKKKLFIPTPLQLAPKHCNCVKCEWRGQEKLCEQKYVTIADMRAYYEKQARVIASGVKAEAIEAIAKIQAFYLAALKEKEEKAKQLILEHQEIVNTLAKEAASTEERRNKEKEFKKKFGVRNTGSFKKKAKKLLKRETSVSLEVISTVHEVVKTPLQVCEECDSEWTEVQKKKKNKPHDEKKRVVDRMCNSVITGEPCEHGENCCFVHNWDELVLSECRFGSDCKHVKKQSEGVYTLVEGKYCKYKHPKETKESVCVRFGMPPKVIITEIIDLKPRPPRSIMKEAVKFVRLDTVKTITLNPQVSEEVVIRVQKELAVQAIEFAVKAGKNNIRVELV